MIRPHRRLIYFCIHIQKYYLCQTFLYMHPWWQKSMNLVHVIIFQHNHKQQVVFLFRSQHRDVAIQRMHVPYGQDDRFQHHLESYLPLTQLSKIIGGDRFLWISKLFLLHWFKIGLLSRTYRFRAARDVKYPVQNMCGPSAYGKKSSVTSSIEYSRDFPVSGLVKSSCFDFR